MKKTECHRSLSAKTFADRLLLAAVAFTLQLGVLSGAQSGSTNAAGDDAAVKPASTAAVIDAASQRGDFLRQYCSGCHNQKLLTGGLDMSALDPKDVSQGAITWEKIVRKLETGAMPPAGVRRPDKSNLRAFLNDLEASLDRAAAEHPDPGRPGAIHRLNRSEYLNATRDLLHVELTPEDQLQLPPDSTGSGFDNNADVLGLSPLLLERYLSVARKIASIAVGAAPSSGITVYKHLVDFGLSQAKWMDGMPIGTRGGTHFAYNFSVNGEYKIKLRLQRGGVGDTILGLGKGEIGKGGDRSAPPEIIEVRLDGRLVGLFSVSESKTASEPLTLTPAEILSRQDAKADPSSGEMQYRLEHADENLELQVSAQAGSHEVTTAFLAPFMPPVDEGGREPWVAGNGAPSRPMGIDTVTISGPLALKNGDQKDGPALLACSSSDEQSCVRTLLAKVARRAYRRSVTPVEMQEILAAYDEGRAGVGIKAGLGAALRFILINPAFLFRVEPDPDGARPDAPYRITDIQLASRLSFFLWSSLPDEELLDVAQRGQLKDPATLEKEVRRMLADPRADTLVTNFGAQWLSLRLVGGVKPDLGQFTDFDGSLKESFRRETELLLENVFLNDRSVTELISANYTYVNERLALHYGIPNIYGDNFRRVEITDGIRGGLLGQGSILTSTSYPTRTSPVLRGKWILDTLLGSPPPPPPPNVPALPDSGANGKKATVRDRLVEHRKNPACASCHARMDPLGFALENFDAVGRWRTVDSAGLNEPALPIDASGQLADGTKVDGAVGLRHALENHYDEFVYALTDRLLTYAVGRATEWSDGPTIRRIVRDAQKDDYHFSSLVLGVVRSSAFQMRMAEKEQNASSGLPSIAAAQ